MKNYNFKQFKGVGSKLSNYTISFNGNSFTFGFNSGFYVKENIGEYKRVALYMDKENLAVAFRFTKDIEEDTFSILHSNNGKSGSTTAKSFIIDSRIDKKEYYGQKIPKKIKGENGVLYAIDLVTEENN
jgi:hypothetical protein